MVIFSPETLAERWDCSAQHVRNILNTGVIPSFKIGNMFRVRGDAVELFECTQAVERTASPNSEDFGISLGTKRDQTDLPSGDGTVSELLTFKKRRAARRLSMHP